MTRAAIVGAGLIGRAWANVFARAGWQVRVWDPLPAQREQAARLVEQSLHDLARHGLVRDPDTAARGVIVVDTLAEAVADADYVQESGPETLDAKRATFAAAGRRRAAHGDPRLVDIGDRGVAVHGGPRRPRALHRRASGQSAASRAGRRVVRSAVDVGRDAGGAPARSSRQSGQAPIDVKREIDGFILNRLQAALLTEAFRLVQDGFVEPARPRPHDRGRPRAALGVHGAVRDDRAERSGRDRRTTAGATSTSSAVTHGRSGRRRPSGTMRHGNAQPPRGPPRCPPEEIAAKSLWRDERLAALVAHKRGQPAPDI